MFILAVFWFFCIESSLNNRNLVAKFLWITCTSDYYDDPGKNTKKYCILFGIVIN